MRINKHDTNGTKPLLGKGELGYDDYTVGGDAGRVYVGTGSVNIPQAKKAEVVAVDGKVDTHVVRVDNPHSVTKIQVGLGSVDNTSDINKPISTAVQTALDTKQAVLVSGTNIKTIEGQSIVGSGNIDLSKSDVGLSNVDNTADATKNVLSATKLTTARTINGVSFDGTANITIADNTKLPIGGKAADADLLDGMQPTTSSAANSIGQRGADAGFAASYYYANGASARFEAASPVNDWKYFRLTSDGIPKWDIATNETNENGALAFRTGEGVNRFLMYPDGRLAASNTMYLQQGVSLKERGTNKEILYHSGELLNIGHEFSDVRINNQKAWHAGNMGSGSGLDADKLDGGQATDFMQVGSSTQDLNSMKTAGTYRVESGHLNMPSGVDFGNILVLRTPGTNTYSQIITDWNSTNIYWRSGSEATGWQPWRRILSDGNALTSAPLGYVSGLGVGGIVVQGSLKTDTVTLNKITGRIIMAATALANNQAVSFLVNNSFATNKDFVGVSAYGTGYNYKVETNWITDGQFQITVTNKSGASLSEALPINFIIAKGAIS